MSQSYEQAQRARTASRTLRIQECQNIKELEILFDEFKTVEGSHKTYNSSDLKAKIEQLRMMLQTLPFDEIPWNIITRTYGIRAKCMELFYYEKHEI